MRLHFIFFTLILFFMVIFLLQVAIFRSQCVYSLPNWHKLYICDKNKTNRLIDKNCIEDPRLNVIWKFAVLLKYLCYGLYIWINRLIIYNIIKLLETMELLFTSLLIIIGQQLYSILFGSENSLKPYYLPWKVQPIRNKNHKLQTKKLFCFLGMGA